MRKRQVQNWRCGRAPVQEWLSSANSKASPLVLNRCENLHLNEILKVDIIITSKGKRNYMFEMAFFYGDFSMLPSMQELFENVEHTTTAEEIFYLKR